MDIVERLIAFRDYTKLSNSQFADQAGIPRPTLSQFLNGRNKRLSDDFAAKLHAAYPELNVMWLLFGEGDMLTRSNIEISEAKKADFSAIADSQAPDTPKVESIPYSDENTKDSAPIQSEAPSSMAQEPRWAPVMHVSADPAKTIKSIIVFYSDNSYEIFTPANRSEQ